MNKKLLKIFWLSVFFAIICISVIFYSFYRRAFVTIPNGYSRLDNIDLVISKMTLKEQVSNLFILHTPGTELSNFKNFIDKYHPGGLIFMSDNIPETAEQLKHLTESINGSIELPLFLAIDEEGGVVERLKYDDFDSAIEFKNSSLENIKTAIIGRTQLLASVGLNLNFGIIADITNDENSFMFNRVFGGDPMIVGQKVSTAISVTNPLTLSTIKHFPGHGESNEDSHRQIPVSQISYDDWLSSVAVPFVSGIDSGADFVMFGHLIFESVDSVPASLSKKWHDILTKDLGFRGITITDDMRMLSDSGESDYANPISNAIKAFVAGNDMLLYVSSSEETVNGYSIESIIEGVVDAVKDGTIEYRQLRNSLRKTLQTKNELKVLANPSS